MSIKSIVLTLSVLMISSVSFGRDSQEAFEMLRSAVMESNAEYNKQKKKADYEEFDRADEWSERDSGAIVIGATSEFTEPQDASKNGLREVSSAESK